MLYLNFALDFEHLANEMIETIQNSWHSPFKSPVVIFAERSLEQWFKLRWMSQKGVLANLRIVSLENFLFESIVGMGAKKKLLSVGLLRSILMAWLRKPDAHGEPNYRGLGDIREYIESEKGQDGTTRPDDQRLFDFCNVMASLFIDYERIRPGQFNRKKIDGLIRCWQQNDDFFDGGRLEAWQRALYRAIFVDGDAPAFIRQIFSLEVEVEAQSLSALYENSKDMDGRVHFHHDAEQPVFIFWHAGMAQAYRVMLWAFAEQYDVYAYVQNPCMSFWEDVDNQHRKLIFRENIDEYISMEENGELQQENALLCKWGRAGRENIRLWCEASEYEFIFKEENENIEIPLDSLLHKVQWMVANRVSCLPKMPENGETCNDDSLTLTSAPSVIREIEDLHSRICLLLQKGCKISEMLVVAPDIEKYRSAIYQVFDQAAKRVEWAKAGAASQPGDEGILHIPFTLIDGVPKASMTAAALAILFRIMEKGVFSRVEFFELVRNPLVQAVRSFSPEEVDAWESWVVDMHLYRDRCESRIVFPDGTSADVGERNDWRHGIRRLLVAHLSDAPVLVGDEVVKPFSCIDSDDDVSLCHFVECVEDLEKLCDIVRQHPHGIDEKTLDEGIIPLFNAWFALKEVPKSLASENYIYQNIRKGIDLLRYQYRAMEDPNAVLSVKCMAQVLCSAAESFGYSVGTLFVNGLTFMNFNALRVIPVKHIFYIGMDAGSFPGGQVRNSLNLCRLFAWPGDSSLAARNQYAFLSQLMCTSEGVHCSYVCRDLKKDREFYPSSVIHDLKGFIQDSLGLEWAETCMPLDETNRPLDELYTGRELRNHGLYASMLYSDGKNVVDVASLPKNDNPKYAERVSLYQIRQYIEEPLLFRANEVLVNKFRDNVGEEKKPLEPITIESDIKSKVLKDLIWRCLMEGKDRESVLAENIVQLRLEGTLPEGIYAEAFKQDISWFFEKFSSLLKDDDKALQNKPFEVNLACDNHKWALCAKSPEWYRFVQDEAGGRLFVMSISTSKDIKALNNIKGYVTALAFLSYLCQEKRELDEQREVEITLDCCHVSGRKSESLKMCPDKAIEILNKIYRYAFVEKFAKAAPLSLVQKDKTYQYDDFMESLSKATGWEYLDPSRKLFLETETGYDRHSFEKAWESVKIQQLELIKMP